MTQNKLIEAIELAKKTPIEQWGSVTVGEEKLSLKSVILNAARSTLSQPDVAEMMYNALNGVRMHKCMFDTDEDFNASCDAVNAAIKSYETLKGK